MKRDFFNSEDSEDIFYSFKESKHDFKKHMKLFEAITDYKENKLTLGKAAELAQMKKTDFLFLLAKNNIPVINTAKIFQDKQLSILN